MAVLSIRRLLFRTEGNTPTGNERSLGRGNLEKPIDQLLPPFLEALVLVRNLQPADKSDERIDIEIAQFSAAFLTDSPIERRNASIV